MSYLGDLLVFYFDECQTIFRNQRYTTKLERVKQTESFLCVFGLVCERDPCALCKSPMFFKTQCEIRDFCCNLRVDGQLLDLPKKQFCEPIGIASEMCTYHSHIIIVFNLSVICRRFVGRITDISI